MFAFFDQIVDESEFADRVRESSQATGIQIDELIEQELDQLTELYSKSDDYIVGLVGQDEFLKWLYAREKLLDYDEARNPRGLA